jgi:hypothetical protein
LTLVLRLNQESRAPSLHVPGADRTRRYPTSRLPGHRVPDLCNHPQSSTPGLLLLTWSSSLHAMPHLPPPHHETSKHDSPNETKIKEKQNCLGFEFKHRQVNDSSQSNQGTDHLVSHHRHGPHLPLGPGGAPPLIAPLPPEPCDVGVAFGFVALKHTNRDQQACVKSGKKKGKKSTKNAWHTSRCHESAYGAGAGGGGGSRPTLSWRLASYPSPLGLASWQEPPWCLPAPR